MGKQGRTEGSGFYFTDRKDIAQGYAREEGGKLFEVYLDIKKPMSLEQRKITSKQLNDVLEEVLKKDREALGNYGGDINSIGKENTKKIARDILETNETDVDLISDMINSGILPPQEINDIFRKVSGYDGIITKWPANPGEKPVNLFIALSPDQIKTKSQLTDFYNQAVKGNGFVEETIISRQGIGKTQLESPLKTYNKFAEQEATFRGDIMQDPALGIVGERVGDAFEQVIKLKQDIGATIGNEIKTIGKLKTSTALAQEQFGKNLVEQGLKLNKGILSQTKLSKLTGEDVKLLQRYISELNKLSENPTLAELDAFLSRLPKELEVYKSQNNIIKVTNGERLIKENLTQLRQSASPKINPKFENYFNAKSLYSDLTNFVDEGLRFLGKRTQTGDFARDASLTKSAVQSILNQGKKDWLARLEGLTGYPALDESVLALQAMKDAGNFRGLSLLEVINEGKVPMTKYGIAGKVAEFMVEKGKQLILGSEAEQTRAFLKSLEDELIKP